jgi:hypothetical protein
MSCTCTAPLSLISNSAAVLTAAHTHTIIHTLHVNLFAHVNNRYWLSAGRGDFHVTPKNCSSATLYVCVHAHSPAYSSSSFTTTSSSSSSTATSAGGVSPQKERSKERYAPTGNSEFISSAPLKPLLLASMKSTNYLLNALCAMDSEGGGGVLGNCKNLCQIVKNTVKQ